MLIRLFRNTIMSLVVLAAPAALAHEGHQHGSGPSVKGTVESVEGSKLTLKGMDGKPISVHIDERTEYEKGRSAGAAADLTAGTRVVVQGAKMKDGTVHAKKIRYSAPAKKTGPAGVGQDSKAAAGPDSHAGHDHGAAPAAKPNGAAKQTEASKEAKQGATTK